MRLKRLRLGGVLAVALALGACSSPFVQPPRSGSDASARVPSQDPGQAEPAQGEGEGADVERDSGAAPAQRSSAAIALLAESRADRDSGDLSGAAATIERALSIAPDDALLWIELAEIRIAQGDRAQGEEMARKALTLTGGDPALEARARRLIAR
jgi:Flp pilus assembly protein TadD